MRSLLIASVLAFTAGPAFADDAIRISTAGRDLSSAAGVAGLHAQIERAARKACGLTTRLSARGYQQRAACVREKVDEAVQHVGLPALTALHETWKASQRS